MAKLLAFCAILVAFNVNLALDFGLHLVGAVDPTLLKPNTHETIIDEMDDTKPSKKSNMHGENNDLSFKYFNYRIGSRTNDAAVAKHIIISNTGPSNSTEGAGKNGSIGSMGQVLYNNQNVNNIQQKQEGTNTQIGAGVRQYGSQNNNSSIAKALAFYESILANAKKNEHESRNMKSETAEERQKNYADGIENSSSEDELNVCRSEECRNLSKYIKDSLDNSTNPCDDFYTFACGGWKRRNNIPESENEITAFTKLTKKIENATHILLTQPPKPGQSEALDKARKFFASCMDREKIEAKGAKPALDFIKSIGGWSMCGNKDWSKDWDVYKVMRDVQGKYYPAPPFFTVEVTNDHLNSTRHLVKVRVYM